MAEISRLSPTNNSLNTAFQSSWGNNDLSAKDQSAGLGVEDPAFDVIARNNDSSTLERFNQQPTGLERLALQPTSLDKLTSTFEPGIPSRSFILAQGNFGPDVVLAQVQTQETDRVQEILDKGDDYDVSDNELKEIEGILTEMSSIQRNATLSGLSDEQLDILFHNVHSSGFWSNDLSPSERHDFYSNVLGGTSEETVGSIAQVSPLSAEHLAIYQGAGDLQPAYDVNWSHLDIVRWQAGDGDHLFNEKGRFVEANREVFAAAADAFDIPPLLVAGVAYNEFGGDPLWIDSVAYDVRNFDHSGPDWVDDNLTITSEPDKTSFGDMSIQVRTAADTLGYDPANLSDQQREVVIETLQDPQTAIFVAAQHLSDLRDIDHRGVSAAEMTDDQLIEIATRYNRGGGLSQERIQDNLGYGEALLGHRADLQDALNGQFEVR